jgi:hypothetical protein
MADVVPRIEGLRGEGSRTDPHFPSEEGDRASRGVDWSAAAPTWLSMISGFVLPSLAGIALVVLVDLAFCWLLRSWIIPSWNVAPWLLATMVFPLALLSSFVGAKLFLNFNQRLRAVVKFGLRGWAGITGFLTS